MLHMAKRLGRPIKWLSTRSEDFLTDNHGRAIRLEGELAFDASGRFIALRTNWLCDSGAYLTQAGAFTNSFNGMTIGANVYQVEALYGRHRQLMTNTAPTNAYRGAGRPEAVYIVERLVDAAAAMLGIDPLVLRRRNVIRRTQMPYKTVTGAVFDSGDFAGLIDKVEGGLALGELRAAPARGGAARRAARHRLLGVPGAVRRRPGAEGPGRHPLRREQPDPALQRGRTERAGARDRVSRAGRRRARHRPDAGDAARRRSRRAGADGKPRHRLAHHPVARQHLQARRRAGDRAGPAARGRRARDLGRRRRVPRRALRRQRHRPRGRPSPR